ncbi:SPX and EXS domain-containing protein [Aspergillus foveolatus]|uniref:SPX and EXS domain-containing protein n=1 Tax=Aspergillus foveolatus TaxID=210207 RepID=UPI003CCCADEF
MKFAKELEHELVPEWRAKYLDYKLGKKKVKAIARAIQKANRTPTHASLRRPTVGAEFLDTPAGSNRSVSFWRAEKRAEGGEAQNSIASPSPASRSTPGQRHERQPLRVPGSRFSAVHGSYGSIIASPPQHPGVSDAASLELPGPAMDVDEDSRYSDRYMDHAVSPTYSFSVTPRHGMNRTVSRDSTHLSPSAAKQPATANVGPEKNVTSGSIRRNSRLLNRVLSTTEAAENPVEDHRSEVEKKQDEFFAFLDGELAKIESFYHMREREATERLKVLREQLHTMRDQRIQEVFYVKRHRTEESEQQPSEALSGLNSRRIKAAITGRRIGKNSKALAALTTPGGEQPQDSDVITRRRDFTRHPVEDQQLPKSEVPYRSAKRKLKYALQEFYRGVELLKSYAYLNRTAFRKINKKYDKVVGTRPSMRYMAEKVNKAWFVQSEVTESLLATAEDLYARYFEGGKRKIAASKLRRTVKKAGDYSPNTFRCGLLGMAGVLFAIQSLIYASHHLADDDISRQTNLLLQIYGGYFLIVFHFLLFCVDCMIWNRTKINYWRLLLAGLYPVEFRDFFLGDMYCSQTYAMGNIELFFCLYAKHWGGSSTQCTSSHSRLLGFFTTLPSIWRAFQCIRRYVDTKNVFPHLLNLGKYMCGVLYYATLSMYRINRTTRFQAPFITFALLNAIYVSVWDLAMDWSLGNPYAKHPLLRETLAFRRAWVYYVAIVIDVVIRFNWIFYAIFAHDIQHSAVLSFVISFSEIFRRGIWTVFRVENEHCTNVLLFRASRDVPLPYSVPCADGQIEQQQPPEPEVHEVQASLTAVPTHDFEEAAPSPGVASARPRTLTRVGTIMAAAHAQDFQRKKRPDEMGGATVAHGGPESPDDSSDEDDSGETQPYRDTDHAIEEEAPSDDTQ